MTIPTNTPLSKNQESHLIQLERYAISYKLTPLMMLANFLTAPVLVALMWDAVPHNVLNAWLAVVIIACVLTMIFYFYLKPFFKELSTVPDKLFYYQLPLFFGFIWGAAGFFFFTPDSIPHMLFLIIFLFGMTSGAVTALSSLWFAYIALVVPTLLPFTARLFLEGQTNSTLLGITNFIFLLIMIALSKLTYDSIGSSLKIRYENINLLKDLERQKNKAIEASKDKSRFLSAASHDLRQPVHSLSLLTSAIEPEISTDKGQKILSQIGVANDVMLNLLNSLLDISKLDADIIEAKLDTVDTQKIIHNVMGEFQLLAEENGLELRSHAPQYFVKSDPVLLEDILRNLLQNAIRYTPKGKILVACRKRQDKVLIQVWDTGNGIAPEHQELIFAEFQQLQNPERDQNKGLGLGLAICRRLVGLIGGSLSLKSRLGYGSVFSLELPAITDPIEIKKHTITINKLVSKKTKQFGFNQATILVIDDNKIVLNAMKNILESWDCKKIILANSIESTVKIAENHQGKIDAIIADYRLRENTTGVDAMNAFYKHVDYKPARVLITGDTSPERMQEITAHGIPVLHKPVKSAHLKTALGSMLRKM